VRLNQKPASETFRARLAQAAIGYGIGFETRIVCSKNLIQGPETSQLPANTKMSLLQKCEHLQGLAICLGGAQSIVHIPRREPDRLSAYEVQDLDERWGRRGSTGLDFPNATHQQFGWRCSDAALSVIDKRT